MAHFRVVSLALVLIASANAQKTPDGYPDLQGIWNIGTVTPMERPAQLAGKAFFTPAEARDWEKTITSRTNRDERQTRGTDADVAAAYNEAWYEPGTRVVRTLRTSVVVDPPDGKIPALTPAAQKAIADRRAAQQRAMRGPEDRSLGERCLYFPTLGPPLTPWGYNNNYSIVQTKDYVAISVEMIHDTRIIPIDLSSMNLPSVTTPHLPKDVRLWAGDSRGHYEGNALVVDTTNFTDKNSFRGSDANLHVVERFTRMDNDTILYRFTIDDPTAFTKPWSGEYTLASSPGPIFEYACHEGNYALPNLLRGAQVQENKK